MKGGYLREDSNSSILARRAFYLCSHLPRSLWCQGRLINPRPDNALLAHRELRTALNKSQEILRGILEAGEDYVEVVVAHMTIDAFAQHAAEICCQSQVAVLVELFVFEARPMSVDLATFNRAAEHEHDVGVSVVGAAVAVLAGG